MLLLECRVEREGMLLHSPDLDRYVIPQTGPESRARELLQPHQEPRQFEVLDAVWHDDQIYVA